MSYAALEGVVSVHVQEAASLYWTRMVRLKLPDFTLWILRRLDDRLLAHLDGLAVEDVHARRVLEAELDSLSSSAAFVACVRALGDRHNQHLDTLLALAEATPGVQDGLLSAFGWVARGHLRGIVAGLLGATDSFRRMVGVAACAMHRVDPGLASDPWFRDPSPLVRARALRASGELGKSEFAPICTNALGDDDANCQFWAAWSGVLLGNRGAALDALTRVGLDEGPHRARAFRLTLQAMDVAIAHATLKRLGGDPDALRRLIDGSGIAGDPTYVPWLMKHMGDDKVARAAGEAFSLITGADLARLELERKPPENLESAPNDNPDDDNVEMDPDEGLPWPDAGRIADWWEKNGSRFQPGARYFMGAPVTREHCIDVLKNGYQRQRILAAHYWCLLEPGTPLFNTSAPAWRQQKLLAQMS